MDRVFVIVQILAVLGLLGYSAKAEGGTRLVTPSAFEEKADARDREYPESRFGSPPAPIDVGTRGGYAAREVEEMDADPETGAFRAPAGLVVGEKAIEEATRSHGKSSRSRMELSTASPSTPTSTSLTSLESGEFRRKGVQEVSIIAGDLGFFPKTVFVSQDTPVRLFVTGASKNTLCIMMDSFQVRKQVRSQKIEEITFTPSTPGQYRFYCPVNGMEGTLIVKELVSSID